MTVNYQGTGAGKRFEKDVLDACNIDTRGTANRYGVQVSIVDGNLIRIPSLPDIEGIVGTGGWQFIAECKVCSGASFPLRKYTEAKKNSRRQLEHMLTRAQYGVTCFFLLHFNSRKTKTIEQHAVTYAVPVHYNLPLWREFAARERMVIGRNECRDDDVAVEVQWNTIGDRGRKLRPDVYGTVLRLRPTL